MVFCQDFTGVGVAGQGAWVSWMSLRTGWARPMPRGSSFAGVAQCHDAEGAILAVRVRHSGSSAGAVEVVTGRVAAQRDAPG